MAEDETAADVIHPYLTGDELLTHPDGRPARYVIDLNDCEDLLAAAAHGPAFDRLKKLVLPTMEGNARQERELLGKEIGPRQSHLKKWWKFWRGRPEFIKKVSELQRYVVCARVTKRPVFEFVSARIHPNDALNAFAVADDYSFGILQSGLHWEWFKARCSTLKGDFRYTSDTVFDSFP